MQSKRVNYLPILICLILSLFTTIIPVNAMSNPNGYDWGNYDWAGFSGEVNVAGDKYTDEANAFRDQVAKQCWLYFINKGYSKEATGAILGNIRAESYFDPTVTESYIPWSSCVFGKTGLGLVGFTYYTLCRDLGNLCHERGVEWTDLNAQLDMIESGLCPSMISYGQIKSADEFKKGTDINKLTLYMILGYERPSLLYDSSHQQLRMSYAKEYYDKYKDLTGEYSAKNNPVECGGGADAKDYSTSSTTSDDSDEDATYTFSSTGYAVRDEWELRGMPDKSDIMKDMNKQNLEEYTVELTGEQTARKSVLKDQIDSYTTEQYTSVFWRIILCIGLGMCIYALLLFLAYIFDISTPFSFFSLVTVFTFGFIKINYTSRPTVAQGFKFGGSEGIHSFADQGMECKKFLFMIIGMVVMGIGITTGSYFQQFNNFRIWLVNLL